MNTLPLHIQGDVFWEDEHATSNSAAAAKYFDVKKISDYLLNDPLGLIDLNVGHLWRGSLQLAQLKGRKYDFANALKWLPRFRNECMNPEAIFLDLKGASRLLNYNGESVYIRPVSPFKEFSGQIFNADRLDKEIAFMRQNKNIQPEEVMCVLAMPNESLGREYRCVFVAGKYVGGSTYMAGGKLFSTSNMRKDFTFTIDFSNPAKILKYILRAICVLALAVLVICAGFEAWRSAWAGDFGANNEPILMFFFRLLGFAVTVLPTIGCIVALFNWIWSD